MRVMGRMSAAERRPSHAGGQDAGSRRCIATGDAGGRAAVDSRLILPDRHGGLADRRLTSVARRPGGPPGRPGPLRGRPGWDPARPPVRGQQPRPARPGDRAVSGIECVWYRDRVYRLYEGSRWKWGADGSRWPPGPRNRCGKAARARSRCVMNPAACCSTRWWSTAGPPPGAIRRRRPSTTAARRARSPELQLRASRRAHLVGLLPARFLDGFAGPDARTFGYRVRKRSSGPASRSTCSGSRPARRPADHGAGGRYPRPVRRRHGPGPPRGGRSATAMALCFGLAGAVCLAASALLLIFRTHLPG